MQIRTLFSCFQTKNEWLSFSSIVVSFFTLYIFLISLFLNQRINTDECSFFVPENAFFVCVLLKHLEAVKVSRFLCKTLKISL